MENNIRIIATCENCGAMILDKLKIRKIISKVTPASTMTQTEYVIEPDECPNCRRKFTGIDNVAELEIKEVNVDD